MIKLCSRIDPQSAPFSVEHLFRTVFFVGVGAGGKLRMYRSHFQ